VSYAFRSVRPRRRQKGSLTPDAMLFLLGASAINVSLIGLCYLRGRGRQGVEAVADRVQDWQDEHGRT